MKYLKELLKENDQIWFNIESDQKKTFLNWAKLNNCSWGDKEIEPEKDFCGNHMGIGRNLILGFVGGHCYFEASNAPQKIDFKDIF